MPASFIPTPAFFRRNLKMLCNISPSSASIVVKTQVNRRFGALWDREKRVASGFLAFY